MKAINFLPVYDENRISEYLVRVSWYTWRTCISLTTCHIPARAPTTFRARLHHSMILSDLGPDHALMECSRLNSLNFEVLKEPEASELPKGLVLGRDENIHIRLTGSTPLDDVGYYTTGMHYTLLVFNKQSGWWEHYNTLQTKLNMYVDPYFEEAKKLHVKISDYFKHMKDSILRKLNENSICKHIMKGDKV
ncbi:hypothetical protein DVH24_026017 [Malus domestica]|uniref:Uncharacterized protein n=1 Tax=Malus domestica TaxID=3750 RepID=A0A498KI89_MALDO|nr:hypothetical protein DVH24_026017 [Malus domestica]